MTPAWPLQPHGSEEVRMYIPMIVVVILIRIAIAYFL